jgi:hypothetical protein
MDSEGKKALVPARGEAIIHVGNHSLQCQVTGVSTQHLVVVSPEAADVGQFIRCLIKLVDLPQWIDGDGFLVQQVQDLRGPRSQIWTLQLRSVAPPGENLLKVFVAARRHVGTKTGAQPRATPGTRPGVGKVGSTVTKTTPKAPTPDASRAGLYHHVRRRPRDKKVRTDRQEASRTTTLAEELKDYLEDSTPIEEIYARALEELDKETKRR